MELEHNGLPFTGTVQVNRCRMPLAVKEGEFGHSREGECVPTEQDVQWKDKRAATFLSTTNMIDICTRRGQMKQKLAVTELCNQHMLDVDKMDQLATYYSFLKKSVKQWKTVLFWLLEISTINAYISYTSCMHHLANSHKIK